MRNNHSLSVSMAGLCILLAGSGSIGGAGISLDLQSQTPKLESITADATGEMPDIRLQFYYNSKGKPLLSAGSTVGGKAVSGTIAVVKKAGGARAYTVTAKGTTLKSLTCTLKGYLESPAAACTWKNGTEKRSYSMRDLPVNVGVTVPVPGSFTFTPVVSSKGKITGTGAIVSGYGNETTNSAILKGQLAKAKLTWQLKQGAQQLTFTGSGGNAGYLGTLRATLPPDIRTYKNFGFPSIVTTPGGQGTATFQGKVLIVTGTSPASAASGVMVTVGSDLNGNGTIEDHEQFSTQTDEGGGYQLTGSVAEGRRAVVEFSLGGFAKQLKVVDPVRAGATVVNNASLKQLVDLKITGKSARSSDGKLELRNLPSTVASVQGRAYNPATEADQFPGEFADDHKNLLISSAFASIEAKDSSGKSLRKLGGTSTVRIQIPKDTWGTLRDLRAGNSQLDVPLYYFDEATGQWKRSNKDGWLEDASGAKISEDQLAALKSGAYTGTAYAVGPITHLSYWNCDWPVETHTCIRGKVTHANGTPAFLMVVTVSGTTYNGIDSPKITSTDGSFCADVMRSEQPGEDINGNGVTGEAQQISILVFDGLDYYEFRPITTPQAQGTCEEGSCVDLGELRLTDATRLTAKVWTITGTFVDAETGEPVPDADISARDEFYGASGATDFWAHGWFTNQLGNPFLRTDANGAFWMAGPALRGVTLWAFRYYDLTSSTSRGVCGTLNLSSPPSGPVTLRADHQGVFAMFDAAGNSVGGLMQNLADVNCMFAIGTVLYSGGDSGVGQVPYQPGHSLTLDLNKFDFATESDAKVGTITFTATTPLGGTWRTTGVALSGTWGN